MLTVDVASGLNASQRLQLIAMPPAKRRRVLANIGRKVRVASRKRLRTQRDIQGKKWQGRQSGKSRKMLRGISKRMVVLSNSSQTDVTFKHTKTGRIAYAQQYGIAQEMTAAQAAKQYGTPDYKAPASASQAKALRNAGYKIRRKRGKGWKSPTLKWITQNISNGQAGFILRLLRDETPKKSWTINLPARSFLGATQNDINAMAQTLFNANA